MKLKFFVLLFAAVALINVDTGSAEPVEPAIDIEKRQTEKMPMSLQGLKSMWEIQLHGHI